MPTVAEMLGYDENWRPDVLDLAALHEAWGASKRGGKADLHLYCWLEFGKASTKDLTYKEYEEAMNGGRLALIRLLSRSELEVERPSHPAGI